MRMSIRRKKKNFQSQNASPSRNSLPPSPSRSLQSPVYPGGTITIGRSDSPLERDADRVAATVVAKLEKNWSLRSVGLSQEGRIPQAPGPIFSWASSESEGERAHPALESSVRMMQSGGNQLPFSIRREMESGFGRSFDDVRIHTGETARTATELADARAFTIGNHITFAPGQFTPETQSGKLLLAHELAHVGQQERGSGSGLKRMIHRQTIIPPGVVIQQGNENRKIESGNCNTTLNLVLQTRKSIIVSWTKDDIRTGNRKWDRTIQYREANSGADWRSPNGGSTMDSFQNQAAAVGLKPDTDYVFKVTCKNNDRQIAPFSREQIFRTSP